MRHKKLVPSVHYATTNEHINLADSPFFVNTSYCDWQPSGPTRLAAISSFGFSGTNVHLVMEEAPAVEAARVRQADTADANVVIVLSAKKTAATASLRAEPAGTSSSACRSAAGRSGVYPASRTRTDGVRLAFTVNSYDGLLEKLRSYASGESSVAVFTTQSVGEQRDVSHFATDQDANQLLRNWLQNKDLEKTGGAMGAGCAR